MGLESASYISELVAANPVSGDPVNKGDDHVRLLKTVLQTQFPNLTAAAANMTVTELNLLVGLLATASELNILDGATVSTVELNILDGATLTVDELNTLDGILATFSELNILDGATLTVTELNFVDGVTSAIQTQLDAKAASAHSHTSGEISDLDAGDITTGTFAAARIPTIDQAKLGADSVGQSEIKTAFQTITGDGNFTATGGEYVTGHTSQKDNSVALQLNRGVDSVGGATATFAARWRWQSAGFGANNACRLYYINSSPPYDMGNGPIHQFIYAVINNATGKIESLSISRDPIWVYNGPTNCRPFFYERKTGKVWRRRKDMSNFAMTLKESIIAGGGAIRDYSQAFQDASFILEELTQELKHADMNIVPHPFTGNDMTGKTPVLLDPISPVMRKLKHLSRHDEADISDIVQNYLKIGNTDLDRIGPAGLLIPSVNWKLT